MAIPVLFSLGETRNRRLTGNALSPSEHNVAGGRGTRIPSMSVIAISQDLNEKFDNATHSWYPRRRCRWLDLWSIGNLAGWRYDRLHHCRVGWRGDFDLDYAVGEKSLTVENYA